MYIPLNLKVEFENLTVAYEKLNVQKVQTQMINTKCRIDCAKFNVKWNIEFLAEWNAILAGEVLAKLGRIGSGLSKINAFVQRFCTL